MQAWVVAAALAAPSPPPLVRHYIVLEPHTYHHELQVAIQDEKIILVAFLNDSSPAFAADERRFNDVVNDAGCLLPADGSFAMRSHISEQARFIATSFAEDNGLVHDEELAMPFMALFDFSARLLAVFQDGAPTRYPRSTHPLSAKSEVDNFNRQWTTTPPTTAVNTWTTAAMVRWVYAQFDLGVVRDDRGLEAFAASVPRATIGIFGSLCDRMAQNFHSAVFNQRIDARNVRAGGGFSTGPINAPLAAAVTSNATLALAASPILGGEGDGDSVRRTPPSLITLVGRGPGRGARLSFPAKRRMSKTEVGLWLSDVAAAPAEEAAERPEAETEGGRRAAGEGEHTTEDEDKHEAALDAALGRMSDEQRQEYWDTHGTRQDSAKDEV